MVTKSNAQRHGMVMWDEIAAEVAREFPDVTWDKMLVDAMTMRMVMQAADLDTIVATNLHADILSDLAAALAGSLGIAPTAQHQSGAARPVDVRADPRLRLRHHRQGHRQSGRRRSGPRAMMLEHLGEKPAADRLMRAIEQVTADPALHTPDLGGKATTQQVTDAVCEALRQAKMNECQALRVVFGRAVLLALTRRAERSTSPASGRGEARSGRPLSQAGEVKQEGVTPLQPFSGQRLLTSASPPGSPAAAARRCW